MSLDVLGPNFIGQNHLRRRLNFMVEGHNRTGFLENLLFASRYGAGKTFACRQIMHNLTDGKGKPKKHIEINSASLQNVQAFFDQIITPHVANGDKVSLFFDEIDAASKRVHQTLLTILQYDPETKQSQMLHNGNSFNFDFNSLTVLASSTDPQAIHPALLNRFRFLEMQEYSHSELIQILYRYTKKIKFLNDVEKEIILTSRKSPRHIALRLSNDINQYCAQKENDEFNSKDWCTLSRTLRILPHGISENEYMLLKHLRNSPCSLTNLCGKMQMTPQSLRRNVELFLTTEDYMKIEGKRTITQKGINLLDEIISWEQT